MKKINMIVGFIALIAGYFIALYAIVSIAIHLLYGIDATKDVELLMWSFALIIAGVYSWVSRNK